MKRWLKLYLAWLSLWLLAGYILGWHMLFEYHYLHH